MSDETQERPAAPKTIWRQRIALYGGILAVLIAAAVIARLYNAGNSVKLAAPSEDVAYSGASFRYALETAPERSADTPLMYRQGDPAWKDEPIGDVGYTVGEAGSLACVLAYDAPVEIDPGQVNRLLNAAQAYSQTGNVNWNKVSEQLAPMRYTPHSGADRFSPSLAIDSLREGKSVLLLVAGKDNMAQWLWLARIDQGQYLVYRPGAAQAEALDAQTPVYTLVVGECIP